MSDTERALVDIWKTLENLTIQQEHIGNMLTVMAKVQCHKAGLNFEEQLEQAKKIE